MTHATARAALFAVPLLAAACGRGAPITPGSGPTATLTDSIVIQDIDTFPRGPQANAAVRSALGDLYIQVTDRVLHFDRDGKFVMAFGTSGEGPGELSRATGMHLLPGDSLLAVVSTSRRHLVIFRTADGSVARDVLAGDPFAATMGWAIRGDTAYIPTQFSRRPFRRWLLSTDSVTQWGDAPAAMGADMEMAYMQGGMLSAAPYGDGLLALVPGDSMLTVFGAGGQLVRRVLLPARRRRTVPADINAQLRALIRQRPPDFKLLSPFVLGIHRLSGGSYLIVHFDAVSTYHDDPVRFEFTDPHYWVSLLSADLSRACVDGELPVPPSDVSQPIFTGETLSLLVRGFAAGGTPTAVLRNYRINAAGCDWQATESGPVAQLP